MASSVVESQESERIYIKVEDPNKEQFDDFLIQAIDEALASLGEPVKNTVYQHLEVDFNIPKNEIPEKIGEFSSIMHKIFGLGACRFERKFMKNLNSKVQADIDWPECEGSLSKWIVSEVSFEKYVIKIRKSYETQGLKTL